MGLFCPTAIALLSPGSASAAIYKALPFWSGYVPSFTALTVGGLTPKALAAALTEPPLSRKSRTACSFSESSAGGLPSVPALGRGSVHAGPDPVPDGLPLPLRPGRAACGA